MCIIHLLEVMNTTFYITFYTVLVKVGHFQVHLYGIWSSAVKLNGDKGEVYFEIMILIIPQKNLIGVCVWKQKPKKQWREMHYRLILKEGL